MKGTNTIIVNKQQMIEIINEWWGRVTYNTKDRVTSVDQENMNFVIVLEEQTEDDETNS